jgi:hypothetical protein
MDRRQNNRNHLPNSNMDIFNKIDYVEFNPLGEGHQYIVVYKDNSSKAYLNIQSLLKEHKQLDGVYLDFKYKIYNNEMETDIIKHEPNSLGDILFNR